MNSEAAKNGVLDVRKELERIRDHAEAMSDFGGDQAALGIDNLLQRIPEGWEMRPKDPNQAMLRVVPPGTGAYWRAMWDAAKEEGGG